MRKAIRFLCALNTAMFGLLCMVEAGIAERGYFAIGGEIFAPILFAFVGAILGELICNLLNVRK